MGNYCLTNIGHEIINIFQADNGRFYVYLNSTGDFAADKVGLVKYVLLTRNSSIPNTVQIIGKAKVIRELYIPPKSKSSTSEDQKDNPEISSICYGGAGIVDLFKSNTKGQNIYVTYEVDAIVEPEQDLFLSFDIPYNESVKNTLFINDKGRTPDTAIMMARASLKQYIINDVDKSAFEKLEKAINNKSLWKASPVGKVELDGAVGKKDNFFNICRIQNDELAYSNAFAYLADKYRKEFCVFAKRVLGVSLSEDFVINREKWNIDILVSDKKNVVVLENKVLSHINGLWFDRKANQETSQLEKYWNIVTGNEDKFNQPDKDGHREYDGCKSFFFVVAPDHNNIDLNKYPKGENYEKIVYSQIRDFLKSYNSKDLFIEQLLLAMEPHCQKAFDFYAEMKALFLEQCEKYRNTHNQET